MVLLNYDHEKPLDVIQVNDIVNYKGNDELGFIKQMHVEHVITTAGNVEDTKTTICAYKYLKNAKPSGTQRIEITDNETNFTKLVVKSSLANDPLTKAINFCNFTLADHGLKVGHVYDPVKDKKLHKTTSNKNGIYNNKLYTKSVLEKLYTACLILPTGEVRDGYEVYCDLEKETPKDMCELTIDILKGNILLPNGRIIKITDSLKVRCGAENELVFFKTSNGYISDYTVITEFWDMQVDGGEYEMLYSRGI